VVGPDRSPVIIRTKTDDFNDLKRVINNEEVGLALIKALGGVEPVAIIGISLMNYLPGSYWEIKIQYKESAPMETDSELWLHGYVPPIFQK